MTVVDVQRTPFQMLEAQQSARLLCWSWAAAVCCYRAAADRVNFCCVVCVGCGQEGPNRPQRQLIGQILGQLSAPDICPTSFFIGLWKK